MNPLKDSGLALSYSFDGMLAIYNFGTPMQSTPLPNLLNLKNQDRFLLDYDINNFF